ARGIRAARVGAAAARRAVPAAEVGGCARRSVSDQDRRTASDRVGRGVPGSLVGGAGLVARDPQANRKVSMKLLRSERFPAFLLLGAAALGLIVANLPFGDAVVEWSHLEVGPAALGLNLSLSHWVADLLLAVFFFGVAVELQYEMTRGQLNSLTKIVKPAIAAAGGVLVPILVYLLLAGHGDTSQGWPIPTATDIAFALGVLAMFGKGLPTKVRVFLLALAIIDDIVG